MSAGVTGHLDGLRGSDIVGWAFSANHACQIVAYDSQGNVLGSGHANATRPDLLCLGHGRCDFAFQIPIIFRDHVNVVHVRANGVELRNSPLTIDAGQFDGYFESNQGVIDGWVIERKAEAVSPYVTVIDQDGLTVFQSQAHRDAAGACDGTTPFRFTGKLDAHCFGAGERRLSAFANGIKFAEADCNLSLQGNVETLLADRCTGWLLSVDAPARPFEFEIIRNGEVVATAKCDIPRSDVQALYPGTLKSGFACDLPALTSSIMDFTTISMRFSGSDRELFDGPFVIASRPAVIEAARTASSLSSYVPENLRGRSMQIVLQAAIYDFLAKSRTADTTVFRKAFLASGPLDTKLRLTIIVPVYRGLEVTRACIASVLSCRSSSQHRVILVHDRSPESEMLGMLQSFCKEPNVFCLNNTNNIGFIRSVNRALSFCGREDVLLLNSDTCVFAGAFDRLLRVAHSAPDIGTVTAMSNNATIFSYPHYTERRDALEDISWEGVADIAFEFNGDMSIDVPSGHGFCLLIKRQVLDKIPTLDEAFGRGYGEENDLCARAADLGYRNVAAAGVFVEHRESVSFLEEKHKLLSQNLPRLESRYPEYTPTIIEMERRDVLRAARWALDGERLRSAREQGGRFVLVVNHKLGGGTSKAVADIESLVGYGGAIKIALSCRSDGYLELTCKSPLIQATFAPDEVRALFRTLDSSNIVLAIVHQVLGFTPEFIAEFKARLSRYKSVFYAHDFYTFCPRVTMIDALGQFCNQAPVSVCTRCLALSGAHPSSRFGDMSPTQHRLAFKDFLLSFENVVTPSVSAAAYLTTAFPELRVDAIPHPSSPAFAPPAPRSGDDRIVLFGALGLHKGSRILFEVARLALLRYPALRFTIVGYTDIDAELLKLENVSVTGAYAPKDLPYIVSGISGRIALFLSTWPETFSYTLSEAVALGFFPVVPDIGAPAERVRASGFGAVFPFPIVAEQVVKLLDTLRADISEVSAGPQSLHYRSTMDWSVERTRILYSAVNSSSSSLENEETIRACGPEGRRDGLMLQEGGLC